MPDCKDCKKPVGVLCCFNCGRSGTNCEVWHTCGKNCPGWTEQNKQRLIDKDKVMQLLRRIANIQAIDVTAEVYFKEGVDTAIAVVDVAPTVDAIPIDDVAAMLAELFGEECCCNYNGIDEWLPFVCEHSDTCPDTIGKNGCWKQFIKHWKERKKDAVD